MPAFPSISESVPSYTTNVLESTDYDSWALCNAFTVQWRDGVLRVRWNQGMSVSGDDAAELVRAVDALCPGMFPPMTIELNEMVSVSRCALHIFATELNPSAMAIFGPSAVDAILALFFVQVHRPSYPTAFFTTSAEALAWLGSA